MHSACSKELRYLFVLVLATLLGACSTTGVIPEEASSAVPPDYITRRPLPVTLEEAASLLSHYGHTGDELVFADAQGERFTVYRLLRWRTDAPLFSPSREVGRLAVGDTQTEIRLVDYRGEEGRVLLSMLLSVPDENQGSGFAKSCAEFLKKKRKGLPSESVNSMPSDSPSIHEE